MLFRLWLTERSFKTLSVPKLSYEYDIRLNSGANVQNNQKKARDKQYIDFLSFHSIDELN